MSASEIRRQCFVFKILFSHNVHRAKSHLQNKQFLQIKIELNAKSITLFLLIGLRLRVCTNTNALKGWNIPERHMILTTAWRAARLAGTRKELPRRGLDPISWDNSCRIHQTASRKEPIDQKVVKSQH